MELWTVKHWKVDVAVRVLSGISFKKKSMQQEILIISYDWDMASVPIHCISRSIPYQLIVVLLTKCCLLCPTAHSKPDFFYSVLTVPQNGQLYCYWALILYLCGCVNRQEQHSADIHIEFLTYFPLGEKCSFIIEDIDCSVQLLFGNTHLGWLSGTKASFESSVIVVRNPLQTPVDFFCEYHWWTFIVSPLVMVANSQISDSISESNIFMQAILRTILLRMCLLKTTTVFCGVFLWPTW